MGKGNRQNSHVPSEQVMALRVGSGVRGKYVPRDAQGPVYGWLTRLGATQKRRPTDELDSGRPGGYSADDRDRHSLSSPVVPWQLTTNSEL